MKTSGFKPFQSNSKFSRLHWLKVVKWLPSGKHKRKHKYSMMQGHSLVTNYILKLDCNYNKKNSGYSLLGSALKYNQKDAFAWIFYRDPCCWKPDKMYHFSTSDRVTFLLFRLRAWPNLPFSPEREWRHQSLLYTFARRKLPLRFSNNIWLKR